MSESEVNREYYNGHLVSINNDGYKRITITKDCTHIPKMIHIEEGCKKYGLSELPDGYNIHHLDGNKLNNDPNNLILLTASDHTTLHMFLRKHPECLGLSEEETKRLIDFAKEFVDMKTGDIRKDKEIELSCLKSKRSRAEKEGSFDLVRLIDSEIRKVRDEIIEIKKQESLTRKPKPTCDELIEKLKEFQHMENLGRYYGVSSSAIRKWCKEYGIDFRKYTFTKLSNKITRVCPVCGKTFITTEKANKIYCSSECRLNETRSKINLDDACDLHYNKGYSYRKIANIYGITHQNLIRQMNKYYETWKSKQ